MNIETQVCAALEPLAPGKVFPDVAPEGTTRPFLTFQVIGGEPLSFLDGTRPDKEFARVQVNVWANTRMEASNLGRAAEEALCGAANLRTEVLTGRIATFDPDTQFRGTMQDFSFFT